MVMADSTALSRRRFFRRVAAGTASVSATLSLAACGGGDDADPALGFTHGVASGDPLSNRLVIWTRAVPEGNGEGDVSVDWQVATDDAFTAVVRSGSATTNASRDFTVKVDVDGLSPATVYRYRFRKGDRTSPVGKGKTLPVGKVDAVRLAVVSCSNYPAGYFHVYAEVAKRTDLDAAVHLGDYIYEYASTGYASEKAVALGRVSDPANEIVVLADYRRRYAQYRSDPDLQKAHAALAFITVWDDHEITNDAWTDGAENHQPATEGDFALRKAAAVRAYHEWLPTREQSPLNKIYRSFDFGELMSLHMLDTRVIARNKQLDYSTYFPALLGNPDPVAGVQAFLAQFAGDVSKADRQLLGAEQTTWLQQRMSASKATWQVLGQQVLMGAVQIPLPVLLGLLEGAGQLGNVQIPATIKLDPVAYLTLLGRQAAGDPTLTAAQKALLSLPSIPYNLDSWDGYWAARETVFEIARALDKNLVVLAGDTHNAWSSDLRVGAGSFAGTPVGVEFATSSVTSPGFEEYLGAGFPADQLAFALTSLANLNTLGAGVRLAGSLKYAETAKRGYLVMTVTATEARSDWYVVDTVQAKTYQTSLNKSLRALPGAANRKLVAV
jgi:alkaline phosphatase D